MLTGTTPRHAKEQTAIKIAGDVGHQSIWLKTAKRRRPKKESMETRKGTGESEAS